MTKIWLEFILNSVFNSIIAWLLSFDKTKKMEYIGKRIAAEWAISEERRIQAMCEQIGGVEIAEGKRLMNNLPLMRSIASY